MDDGLKEALIFFAVFGVVMLITAAISEWAERSGGDDDY